MAMTLFVGNKRLSSWSLRAYLALSHTGLPFETKTLMMDTPTFRAEALAVGPTGLVPVLHHDGLVVWDSLAICEYISELAPHALWPTDRAQRARARTISAEMHSGFSSLRIDMSYALLESRPGVGHTAAALADAGRIQAIWRERLAHGRPFLFGEFTIADAMYAPVASRFRTYGVALDSVCTKYVDTIFALPTMKQWIADAEREPK
ncbi:glutathione S-transferase family protein [soil metagenome]